MPPTPSPTPILIRMVGDGTFWNSPAFIALLTLFGVVVGATLGFWFNWLLEGRKEKRELTHKWDDLIREHGAKAIGAAEILPSELEQAAAAVMKLIEQANENAQASGGPQTLSLGRASSSAHIEVIEASSSLELIAPRPIRQASAHLRITANKIVRNAIADRGVPFAVDVADTTATLTDLEAAARALGDEIRRHFAIE